MGKIASSALASLGPLSVIAIGVGAPSISIYRSVFYGFNEIVAGIVSFIAIVGAGVLGFFLILMVFGKEGRDLLRDRMGRKDKPLMLLRSHVRATLEELDEQAIKEVKNGLILIKERLIGIRDLLKSLRLGKMS